jgi:hypothetical protein
MREDVSRSPVPQVEEAMHRLYNQIACRAIKTFKIINLNTGKTRLNGPPGDFPQPLRHLP